MSASIIGNGGPTAPKRRHRAMSDGRPNQLTDPPTRNARRLGPMPMSIFRRRRAWFACYLLVMLVVVSQLFDLPWPHSPSPSGAKVTMTPAGDGEHTFLDASALQLPMLLSTETANRNISHLRVAVLEHAGFHDEVLGAVIKTMMDIGADFEVYRDGLRWGFEYVLDLGLGYDIEPTHFSSGIFADDVKNGDIDVVIHISCDHVFWDWPRNVEASKAMKANKDLQIICMQHQLEEFGEHEKSSAAWGDAAKENRLQYVVLSHHVRNYLKTFIRRWAAKDRDTTWHRVPVEMFAPIFPLDAMSINDTEAVQVSQYLPKVPDALPARLAILGNIQPWRKNFNNIIRELFEAIRADPAEWGYRAAMTGAGVTYVSAEDPERPPVTLHLIGSLAPTAELEVPDAIRDIVVIHSDLLYLEFYKVLASMDLILPAFRIGDTTYLEKKLSSAVPAGIISKVPVLGDELLLDSYQFLRKPAISLSATGLSEIEAIRRIRKGISPWASEFYSTPPLVLPELPRHGKSSGNPAAAWRQMTLGVAPTADADADKPAGAIRQPSNRGTEEDWDAYHSSLYHANQEVMIRMLLRAEENASINKLRLSNLNKVNTPS